MTEDQWTRFRKAFEYAPPTDDALFVLFADALRSVLEDEELHELTNGGDGASWWPGEDEDVVKASELYARNRGME